MLVWDLAKCMCNSTRVLAAFKKPNTLHVITEVESTQPHGVRVRVRSHTHEMPETRLWTAATYPRDPQLTIAEFTSPLSLPTEYAELVHRGIEHIVHAVLHRSNVTLPPSSMSTCANLAVPGVGSTTLHALLRSTNSRFAHHRHELMPTDLYAKGARCFVTTLRDPADRMVTAFKFENAVHWPPSGSYPMTKMAPGSKHSIGPNDWVSQFRGRSRHRRDSCSGPAGMAPTACVRFMGNLSRLAYLASLPGNIYHNVHHLQPRAPLWTSGPGLATGHGTGFFAPQVAYLADLVARRGPGPPPQRESQLFVKGGDEPVSLHVICVNRYESDWQRFLQAHAGSRDDALHGALSSKWTWTPPKANHRSNFPPFSLHLQNESIDYIRECLFPLDWVLYRRLCEGVPSSLSIIARYASAATCDPLPPIDLFRTSAHVRIDADTTTPAGDSTPPGRAPNGLSN